MPYISIRDDTHPHIVFDGNSEPVPWNAGEMQEVRLCAQFLRITARGLHFPSYSSTYTWLFAGKEKEEVQGWHMTTCTPHPGALCEEKTNGTSLLYFPTGVVDIPDDMAAWEVSVPDQPGYVKTMLRDNVTCTHATSGREINPLDTRYELSLCDLLDNNLDIIYDPKHDRLLYRFDETSIYVYIAISILGIYLVSCLAENIRVIISRDKSRQNPTQQVIYYIMLFSTKMFIVVDFAGKSTRNFLLFAYERTLYDILFAYVLIESVVFMLSELGLMQGLMQRLERLWQERRHEHTKKLIHEEVTLLPIGVTGAPDSDEAKTGEDPDGNHKNAVRGISLLTACIMLMTARVHYSFDNPYTWLLGTIFGIRSFHKFLNRLLAPEVTVANLCRLAMHLFDASVFIMILTYAVVPSYNLTTEANTAVFLILTICMLSAAMIAHHPRHDLS